jgi:hypothetical protein
VRRNADQSIDSKVTSAQPPPSPVHPLTHSPTRSVAHSHSLTLLPSDHIIFTYSNPFNSATPLSFPSTLPPPHHSAHSTLQHYHKHNMSDTKAPEFEPPQACVNRVIKSVLPDNVQVTKDARVRVSLCHYSNTSLCHYLTVPLPHCYTTSLLHFLNNTLRCCITVLCHINFNRQFDCVVCRLLSLARRGSLFSI